jgi:hypothetical protein
MGHGTSRVGAYTRSNLFYWSPELPHVYEELKGLLHNVSSYDALHKALTSFTHGYVYRNANDHIIGLSLWYEVTTFSLTQGKKTTLYLVAIYDTNATMVPNLVLYDIEQYCKLHCIGELHMDMAAPETRTLLTTLGFVECGEGSSCICKHIQVVTPITGFGLLQTLNLIDGR